MRPPLAALSRVIHRDRLGEAHLLGPGTLRFHRAVTAIIPAPVGPVIQVENILLHHLRRARRAAIPAQLILASRQGQALNLRLALALLLEMAQIVSSSIQRRFRKLERHDRTLSLCHTKTLVQTV
jgi:hypothetical protein